MNRKPYPGPPVARHFEVAAADGPRRLRRVTRLIESAGSLALLVIAAVLISMIAIIDAFTSAELSIFYLLPIALLAWYDGWKSARVAVFASGLAWLLADMMSGSTYSNPAIQYWTAGVRTGFFFIVAFILTKLRHSTREEHRLARTDELTGVANSRCFVESASLELARQRRYDHPISIAYLDCDNFKRVNDFYGHSKGDELLRRVALCTAQTLREVDIVARLGGDEFAILLPESDQRAAAAVMKKLRNALKMVGEQYGVTFSMGVVTYLQPAENVDVMLNAADKLMYEVKRSGKNASRYKVFGKNGNAEDEQGVLPL